MWHCWSEWKHHRRLVHSWSEFSIVDWYCNIIYCGLVGWDQDITSFVESLVLFEHHQIIIELHCDITIFYYIIGQYRDIFNIYDRISAPDRALGPGLMSWKVSEPEHYGYSCWLFNFCIWELMEEHRWFIFYFDMVMTIVPYHLSDYLRLNYNNF